MFLIIPLLGSQTFRMFESCQLEGFHRWRIPKKWMQILTSNQTDPVRKRGAAVRLNMQRKVVSVQGISFLMQYLCNILLDLQTKIVERKVIDIIPKRVFYFL